MELVIYTNRSDDKVVTKNIVVLGTIDGVLRDDCSIIDPVIAVSSDVMNNAMAAHCNYAKIAQFGRYYYVNNITLQGKFWILHMHVDVLASFQTELKGLEAVIARNETRYNLYLQDGYFKTYQNPHVSIRPFPAGFDEQYYVLSVAGSGGHTPTATTNAVDNDPDVDRI